MGRKVTVIYALTVLLCSKVARVSSDVECGTVTTLVTSCSSFTTYGAPQPTMGSTCCNSVVSLNSMADSADNRRSVCRCLVALFASSNPNPSAIAALPALCGISNLGFTISPNIDCNALP